MTKHPEGDNYDDILEAAQLGKEPSAEYLERLSALDGLIRECMQVSRAYAGIPSPSNQHYYASLLFTAMITRAVSLAIAAPHSPWAKKLIEHWDYATLTGIVRTMLEVRLAFYYLCVDPCSTEEWDCRWNVFNLHDCLSRRKLFVASGDSREVGNFEKQADELRGRLTANTFFAALPAGQKKNLLSGKTAFLYSLEDISERAGLDRQRFKYLYVLFSSHVHGLPMSFYRIGEKRGRGLPTPTEEGYTSLCLSFAVTLLVRTRDEVRALFSDFIEREKNKPQTPLESQVDETIKKGPALNEPITIYSEGDIRIVVTRTAEALFEIVYYFANEPILRRSISEESGSALQEFDPVFWTILVNGRAATANMLGPILEKPHAIKVDPEKRTMSFKT